MCCHKFPSQKQSQNMFKSVYMHAQSNKSDVFLLNWPSQTLKHKDSMTTMRETRKKRNQTKCSVAFEMKQYNQTIKLYIYQAC